MKKLKYKVLRRGNFSDKVELYGDNGTYIVYVDYDESHQVSMVRLGLDEKVVVLPFEPTQLEMDAAVREILDYAEAQPASDKPWVKPNADYYRS